LDAQIRTPVPLEVVSKRWMGKVAHRLSPPIHAVREQRR
jgi:hypothetical protein